MEWTLDQIYQFAPDRPTLDRAFVLVKPKKWALLACHGPLLWGECRTSGALRYRIACDLDHQRFFSNSPAPLKPDKYLLALLLLFFESPDAFSQPAAIPDWVKSALDAAASSPTEKEKKDKQGSDRLRNQEKRLALMGEGASDLGQWLRDAAFQGLGMLQSQNDAFWEQFASRLTDSKLGGLAKRIRRMGALRNGSDWNRLFLDELADLFLWSEGFLRLDELPPDLRAEILQQGGLAFRKEDLLKEAPPVEDLWFVLAREYATEDPLRVRKVWLWGQQTGRPALFLDYAWGETPFDPTWDTGTCWEGPLHFYPSPAPLRAVPGACTPVDAFLEPVQGVCGTLNGLAEGFAHALAGSPWTKAYPFFLDGVYFAREGDSFFIAGRDRQKAAVQAPLPLAWSLFSLSGGHPLSLFGLWDGAEFTPLAAFSDGRLISFENPGMTS
ncbi:MAG: hypothetical protein IPH16_00475 [Haliscomenobacter sp.]|nr:hypothetical protein [Haliscomenobacter sp.]